MITKFNIFESKLKGKMVNVDYKIFHQDWKGNPLALVTEFKINKIEGNYIYVISKGYEYRNISSFDTKKGWVPYDDFNTKNIKKFQKKSVQDGTKRIKVYFDN